MPAGSGTGLNNLHVHDGSFGTHTSYDVSSVSSVSSTVAAASLQYGTAADPPQLTSDRVWRSKTQL